MTFTQYGKNLIIVAIDGFNGVTNNHVDVTKQEGK